MRLILIQQRTGVDQVGEPVVGFLEAVFLAPHDAINLLPDERVDVLPGVPAHPAVEVAVAGDDAAAVLDPVVAARAEGVGEGLVGVEGALGAEDGVVAAAEEQEGDVLEAADVLLGVEALEQRAVGHDAALGPLLHEQVQQGHVDAAEEAVDLAVRGLVEVAVVPAPPEDERAPVAARVVADLAALVGQEAQQLVERLLHVAIVGPRAAAEPRPRQQLVHAVERRRRRHDLDHVQRVPHRVHEHLAARHPADPARRDRAVQQARRERHAAHAVRDRVDLALPVVRADVLEGGLEVQPRIVRRPAVLRCHENADAVDRDEDAVARSPEVVDRVVTNGRQCVYLMVY